MQAEVRPEDKVITVDAHNNGTKNILIETKKVLFLIKLVTCNGGSSNSEGNILL